MTEISATGVSAVVVNFNGGNRVLRCVESLTSQDPAFLEIILVDNGSSDGSPEQVRTSFPHVKIKLLGENRGPAAARDAGLRLATGLLALLIDSDVYLGEGSLGKLFGRYASDGPAVVCPRILYYPDSDRIQCDGAAAHFVGTMILLNEGRLAARAPAEPLPVGGAISACLLVDRLNALNAGSFDEDYFIYLEDLEFSYRMRSLGYRFICEPGAVAYHDRGEGVLGLSYRGRGAYPRRRFHLTVRNRLLTLLIHYRLQTLAVLAPALVAYELAALATALSRGWIREWLAAWWWLTRNRDEIRRKRKLMQRERSLSDQELLAGGPLPLARGLVRSRPARFAVGLFSGTLEAYWRVARGWIG